MANGFFQPKPNRFLLASQLFRQAPTTHWTGALAQALGGLTAGIGQRRQQADIAGQQQAFQQAIMGMLPQAQQPTAIPAQPMAQDLTPMGQALSGLAETGGRPDMIPAGQQAQAVGIAPQPTPAGIPAQPTMAQPQPQQGVAGGINPQVISQLIAGGQPQLAMQLVGQAKARQQQLADVAGGRAFETGKIKQGQTFEATEKEKDRQLERDLAMLQLQVESMKPEDLTPFEQELQKKTAEELLNAKTGFLDVKNTHADVSNKLKMIGGALSQALTGGWVPYKQFIARYGPEGLAKLVGADKAKLEATRIVESNLKSMVGAVLKSTFGGVVSEGEREFLRDSFAKETQTEEEIRRSLEIIQKWQNMALRNAGAKLNNLVATAQQFTKQIDIGAFGAGALPTQQPMRQPTQTQQRVKVTAPASEASNILNKFKVER